MRITLLALTLILSIVVKAQTPEATQLRNKREKLQKEMDALRKSLDDTRKNRKASLRELSIMQKQIKLREEQLNTINNQVKLIQGNINNSQYEIARLAGELDTLKEQYKKSIVYSYQHKNNFEFLNFIFSASSFNDGLKRIEYLRSYRQYREQQAAAIKSTQLKLQQKITGLQLHRREKDLMVQDQEKQMRLLAKDKKEKDKFLLSLRGKEKDLAKDLAAKEKVDRELRNGINAAIRREKEKERLAKESAKAATREKATSSPAKKSARVRTDAKTKPYGLTAEGIANSAAFEKSKSSLSWPVEGRVTEHFGRYVVPGTKGIVGNNSGITIEMEIGAPVKSVFDGEVLAIFPVDGREVVMISHGKYYTTYSNLQAVTVVKGQKIEAGQVLGKSAVNDYGKGQVIFMISNDKTTFDPEKWLKTR